MKRHGHVIAESQVVDDAHDEVKDDLGGQRLKLVFFVTDAANNFDLGML